MGSEYQREIKQDVKIFDEKEHLNNFRILKNNLEKFLKKYIENKLNNQSETLKPIEIYKWGENEYDGDRIEIDYKPEGSPYKSYPYEDSYGTYGESDV